jgi:ArsR family transcriptional regulator, arsenate/arsenite/antimonite-responsive transcriptional repressor
MITATQATREETAARQHRALGDTTRQHILSILRKKGGTITVDQLIDVLALRHKILEQPTVSHHLSILRKAGFIAGERHGQFVYYSVCEEAFTRLASTIGGGR